MLTDVDNLAGNIASKLSGYLYPAEVIRPVVTDYQFWLDGPEGHRLLGRGLDDVSHLVWDADWVYGGFYAVVTKNGKALPAEVTEALTTQALQLRGLRSDAATAYDAYRTQVAKEVAGTKYWAKFQGVTGEELARFSPRFGAALSRLAGTGNALLHGLNSLRTASAGVLRTGGDIVVARHTFLAEVKLVRHVPTLLAVLIIGNAFYLWSQDTAPEEILMDSAYLFASSKLSLPMALASDQVYEEVKKAIG